MKSKKSHGILAIRLDQGDEVISSISETALANGVHSAVIVSFVGALKGCRLILRKGLEKSIQEHVEVSGTGNISRYKGKPYIHLHIAAGNDERSWVGHLTEGFVDVFCEVFIMPIDLEAIRRYDRSLSNDGVTVPYVLDFGD